MRRSRIKPDYSWPSWRYGPNGESAIFHRQEDVPQDWTRKPGEQPDPLPDMVIVRHDRDELITKLTELGIAINPTWGTAHMKRIIDGDVSPIR